MSIDRLELLDSTVTAANARRDINLNLLQLLYESTNEVPVRITILKAMDDVLKSKENSLFNSIKASLMQVDVNSNVDYKKAAIEMLKAVSPTQIFTGEVELTADVDSELARRFAESPDNTISEHETSLED